MFRKTRALFPNLTQSPVDCLLDKVALILSPSLYPLEERLKTPVIRRFIMQGQDRHHGKTGPLDKLFLALAPCYCFLIRQRMLVKQIHADLVTDIPGVEILHPGVHLFFGDLLQVIDHRGQDARLVDARSP